MLCSSFSSINDNNNNNSKQKKTSDWHHTSNMHYECLEDTKKKICWISTENASHKLNSQWKQWWWHRIFVDSVFQNWSMKSESDINENDWKRCAMWIGRWMHAAAEQIDGCHRQNVPQKIRLRGANANRFDMQRWNSIEGKSVERIER